MHQALLDRVRLQARAARVAARKLAVSPGQQRQAALRLMVEKLQARRQELFAANATDLVAARAAGLAGPLLKRLEISEKVYQYMLSRLEAVAELEDPLGRVLEGHCNPAGLQVQKISVPLGVIALIYESRPNVTTDAAAVCLISGNAVILRGGSESLGSNRVLAAAMQEAVEAAGLPREAVQLIDDQSHASVSALLSLEGLIDVVIPRGGKGLIRKVAEGTNIPVIKHYEGICHQYVAADAPLQWALDVVVNSKCQSVEVCNALETLLVDAGAAPALLPLYREAFEAAGVQLRGCRQTCALLPGITAATQEDWATEYLAPILAVKVVSGVAEAIEHINTFGSGHTDGIITSSLELAREFVAAVDSASVLVNASTRLSGGGDYGLGSVVGISTDKLHARGPVGPRDLCSYKWVVYGRGHLRS